jgi:Family of unknown function (DUF6283)
MSAHHPLQPCGNCPYRKDAPRRLWHRSEFEKLLATDADVIGSVFGCHKHGALPKSERGMCAGWLLDQKKRGVPSLALGMALSDNPDALAAYERVSGAGLDLFPTVEAMCRANGVRP